MNSQYTIILRLLSYFLGAGVVQFSLRNTTYQNNSLVTLEDIGDEDDPLLCITNLTTCCRSKNRSALGQWFFPNGTNVLSTGKQEDFHRTRGPMMVLLHRRRGGVDGIYRCEIIPDSTHVFQTNQTAYIGVYTSSSGEWQCVLLFCFSSILLCNKEEIVVTKVKGICFVLHIHVMDNYTILTWASLVTELQDSNDLPYSWFAVGEIYWCVSTDRPCPTTLLALYSGKVS